MTNLDTRDAASAPLSTTVITAIAVGVGIFLLGGIIVPVVLLIRARRNHQRLVADLEKRGVFITQARRDATDSVARPRNVLRRNSGLPFDAKSGWGALQSVESIRPADTSSGIAHYVPAKPQVIKKTSRLSWPFHSRKISGHSVQMQKLKTSRLSTVIEDPKLSPLRPILSGSANTSRLSVATSNGTPSGQSPSHRLVRHHPALPSPEQASTVAPERTSLTNNRSYFRTDAHQRLLRARSVAVVSTSTPVRPHLRARSASSTAQVPGKAPDIILPPLPLDIERIKSEEMRRPNLKHAISKSSVSSIESADTGILGSRLSPIIPRATKARAQKIMKPTSNARPFRDTLDLRAKVLSSQDYLANNATRSTSTPQFPRPPMQSQPRRPRPNSGTAAWSDIECAQAMSDAGPYPTASPLKIQSSPTKRRSITHVSAAGSPERQFQNGPQSREHARVMMSPKRQHSQASSRSSCGNPFQWDPTPFTPGRKPSALKGSPGARQGHRRKNSVRISLVPTFHGPPSRDASSSGLVEPPVPSTGNEAAEVKDDTEADAIDKAQSTGPPRSSTFSPDLKVSATSTQASLMATAPTLPPVTYDESFVVFPADHVLPQLSIKERNRLSNGSIFSLSNFPVTPSIIEPTEYDLDQPTNNSPVQSSLYNNGLPMPQTPYLPQQPFAPREADQHSYMTEDSLLKLDEYDPGRPGLVFQTPPHNASRPFQSAFPTIPEELSVASARNLNSRRSPHDDSPPVSPKSPSRRRSNLNNPAYNTPIRSTYIPEERPETIDPAVLSKDAFNILNSGYDETTNNNIQMGNGSFSNLAQILPADQNTTHSIAGNIHDALFPSSPPLMNSFESPILGHMRCRSQASSIYSSPSARISMSPTHSPTQLPSSAGPCSPRPAHAQLPQQNLAINFAEMPKLNPCPRGPRGSPPRPLRTSIATLRRMNSDAADAEKSKAGKGERRYMRIGREDSLQVPGDESWLDELEDDEDNQELDEAEGRRLVGNVLDDYDEGCTVLSLESTSTDSASTIKPTKPAEQDTSSGAQEFPKRSSSIWEDGEVFWSSTDPPPPLISTSTTKPKQPFQPLASSPLITSTIPPSIPTRKRRSDFSVAKDDAPASPTENKGSPRHHDAKKRRDSSPRRESAGSARRADESTSRYRKRCALGVGTPNVRIQITSPGGHVVSAGAGVRGGQFMSGSLYDSQGFLRY